MNGQKRNAASKYQVIMNKCLCLTWCKWLNFKTICFMLLMDMTWSVYLKTTGEGPQNLCRVFLMLSLSVDSSRYQVLWSDADGPAVGSTVKDKHKRINTYFMVISVNYLFIHFKAMLHSISHWYQEISSFRLKWYLYVLFIQLDCDLFNIFQMYLELRTQC